MAEIGWLISIFRCLNAIGVHESGLIGEDPGETTNNLMPFVVRAAVSR